MKRRLFIDVSWRRSLLLGDDLVLDSLIDAFGHDLFLPQFVFALVGAAGDDRLGANVSDALERLQFFLARRVDVEQGRGGGGRGAAGLAGAARIAGAWGAAVCAKEGAARAIKAAATKARNILDMAISFGLLAFFRQSDAERGGTRKASTFPAFRQLFRRARA